MTSTAQSGRSMPAFLIEGRQVNSSRPEEDIREPRKAILGTCEAISSETFEMQIFNSRNKYKDNFYKFEFYRIEMNSNIQI